MKQTGIRAAKKKETPIRIRAKSTLLILLKCLIFNGKGVMIPNHLFKGKG